eukprot:gnl/TRDRNA2_/TRDRNA2_151452_c1_seq1.p1 gnl/TRDRNA2_/TRDRNA2_151452_c1~~gnl/TRDRNA2_/TRDRNA2_151452_c1_seq1.p1  ORF type:complete len:392 (+),score=73.75 gnl/TRDRNA2_/TRDRNA2_151452_c1_seq1:86-1261(+)
MQSDKQTGEARACSELFVRIEMPAVGLQTHLVFAARSGNGLVSVFDYLAEIVRGLSEDVGEDLLLVDSKGAHQKFQDLRSDALARVDAWQAKLKQAEICRLKESRAKAEMVRMRDDFYKEISHLREQLHLQARAAHAGQSFEPSEMTLFDPLKYLLEEEQTQIDERVNAALSEKTAMMTKEFDAMICEMKEQKESLDCQLQTSRLHVKLKDKWLDSVRDITQTRFNSRSNMVDVSTSTDESMSVWNRQQTRKGTMNLSCAAADGGTGGDVVVEDLTSCMPVAGNEHDKQDSICENNGMRHTPLLPETQDFAAQTQVDALLFDRALRLLEDEVEDQWKALSLSANHAMCEDHVSFEEAEVAEVAAHNSRPAFVVRRASTLSSINFSEAAPLE